MGTSGRGGRPKAPLPSLGGPPAQPSHRLSLLPNQVSLNNPATNKVINPELGQNRKYYIAVKASGTGGDSGWGNIGDGIQGALSKFVASLDPLLVKINLAYEAQLEEMLKEIDAEKERNNMIEDVIKDVDNESSVITNENSLEITDADAAGDEDDLSQNDEEDEN